MPTGQNDGRFQLMQVGLFMRPQNIATQVEVEHMQQFSLCGADVWSAGCGASGSAGNRKLRAEPEAPQPAGRRPTLHNENCWG